jgi:hypothetical protein
MVFFIIFGIIIVVCAIKTTKNSANDFLDFLLLVAAFSLVSFVVLFGLSFIWQDEKTLTEITEPLVSIDTETLNGREFYLVKGTEETFSYATKDDKGVITPQTQHEEKITIVEDEEENPYVTIKAYLKTTPDVSWLVPWVRPSVQQGIDISDTMDLEFHVPAKSTRYYLPTLSE